MGEKPTHASEKPGRTIRGVDHIVGKEAEQLPRHIHAQGLRGLEVDAI
jgi:hypothetical protein